MQDNTGWTPSSEDNFLNLTDKDAINEQEAKGIALAELHVIYHDIDTPIAASFVLNFTKLLLDIFTIGQENGGQPIFWLDILNHHSPIKLFNSCISLLIT